MGSRITSSDNAFDGGKTLHDEYGNVIGTQYPNAFDGGVSTYDQYGNKIATSYQNAFDDGVSTYDQYGNKIATTYGHVMDSGSSTYDAYGNRIADTYQNTFDPTSSTTYLNGQFGSAAGAGAAGLYGTGYTATPSYSGGYSGYSYAPPDKRTILKNKLCTVFRWIGIAGWILDFIYGVLGLVKPDILGLDLSLFTAVYAVSALLISFCSAFEEGFFDWEAIGTMFLISLIFFYIRGQGTYNSGGYNQASAGRAWKAVKQMALTGIMGVIGGNFFGLVSEKFFSKTYRDGSAGLLTDLLYVFSVAGAVWLQFGSRYDSELDIYLKIAYAVLIFLSMYFIIGKHGKYDVSRALFKAVVMTVLSAALVLRYIHMWRPVPFFSAMTSSIAVPYYMIFGGSALLGIAAGAIKRYLSKKKKN